MAQQKSERRNGAEARRKPGETQGIEPAGGAKAAPVKERMRQLGLPLGTAEGGTKGPADGGAVGGLSLTATQAAPKPRSKEKDVVSATMEEVCERLEEALRNVARNDGAPGPDRQSIEQVRKHWPVLLPTLRVSLLEGTFRPGDIRRVWIPKAGGGQRGLGIPNVIDRVVQEAVRQVLEPVYEPTFHDSSHGFRPNRSCHTAIAEAKQHLEDGYEWVVDLDLKDFFNRVNHQRLMARLAKRVRDRRILVLIGQMLRAKVVMPDGVVVQNSEGAPQGGPLSPLLSNIVLDELDWELERRGHRFVRYADDQNVYVRSERAGQRVMASLVDYISRRLRLEVNAAKSAVARPEERHFLGFSLRREPLAGEVQVLLSKRSKERIGEKILQLTPRSFGRSINTCIKAINAFTRGWIGFFGICTEQVKDVLRPLDAHIRRRLRAIQLKQWKRKQTIAQRLIRMGIRRKTAWKTVYKDRRSFWALSHMPAVDTALRNGHWPARGLVSLVELWQTSAHRIVAPVQLTLRLG